MKRWNWWVVGLGALVVVIAGAVSLYFDRADKLAVDEQTLRQAEEARPAAESAETRTDIMSQGFGTDHDFQDMGVRISADGDSTGKSAPNTAAQSPAQNSVKGADPQSPALKNNAPAVQPKTPDKATRSQDGPVESFLKKDPYEGCEVVAERIGPCNAQGQYERVRVYKTAEKYPLVRVADRMQRSEVRGQRSEVRICE